MAGSGLPVPEIRAVDGERGILLKRTSATSRCRRRSGGEPLAPRGAVPPGPGPARRTAARGGARPPSARSASRSPSTSRSCPGRCTSSGSTSSRAIASATSRSRIAPRSRNGFHRLCAKIFVLAARARPPRLPQPQPDVALIDTARLDRFPGRAHRPAALRPGLLLRDSYVDLDEASSPTGKQSPAADPGEARDVFQRHFELMSMQRELKLWARSATCTARGQPRLPALRPTHLAHARGDLVRYPSSAGAGRRGPACGGAASDGSTEA